MKNKIIIVGSMNMDMILKTESLVKAGETVLSESLEFQPGGKGANQACAAAKLRGNAVMLATAAQDENGEKLLKSLYNSGVDISKIKVLKNESSGIAVINIDKFGNNDIIVFQGSNAKADCEYIDSVSRVFSNGDIVLISMEIPISAVIHTIKTAKSSGCTVILNPAPAPNLSDFPEEIFPLIDYLIPNETEALKLSSLPGEEFSDISKASQFLFKKGIKNIITTLGEKGALLINLSGQKLFSARAVHAVDTTAAGDCFCAALAVYLQEGHSAEASVEFANTAASLAVTKKGAQSSLPNREDIERLL